MAHPLFTQRIAVLATMHHKEKAIAPILEQELGIQVIVPEGLDTDAFGTFTRDRERPGTQVEAARLKAEKALDLTGETLAIASEGVFAPNPSFPAIPCNRELVLLLDKANQLEIVGQEFSLETNYSHTTVQDFQAALKFAEKVGFPEHGLVVMVSQSAKHPDEIFKGITSERQLLDAVTLALERSPNGTIHLETDMRALYNPTRMAVIEKATLDLVKKINCVCPVCSTPGFELIERRAGLPCGLCGLPTFLTHTALYRCQKCDFSQEIFFPDGMEVADPAQCNYCNP
ncbi:DUF6671 family protein [Leptothermofonsia sp. ETS-13]|uniref:DUF6671 family protein n=1 Tax=Leptothermofonsia sp. ETS-13 TaxID=3035696 RepID=UPI003BA0D6F6